MSDFQISDYQLAKECEELAKAIFAEVMEDHPGEDPEDYRDEMDERAHETADGHQWVIYSHKSLMLCAHCDTSYGDDFLSDVGMTWDSDSTIYTVATKIAYGEMRGRITFEIQELVDAWEAPQEPEGEADAT